MHAPMKTREIRLKVIGIGGAGQYAVNYLIDNYDFQNTEFIVINSTSKHMVASKADTNILIGEKTSKGLGVSDNEDELAAAFNEKLEEINNIFLKTDVVVLVGGVGRNTSSYVIPRIAKIARDKGILNISVVRTPFPYSGNSEQQLAQKALKEVKSNSEGTIVISNEKMVENAIKDDKLFKETLDDSNKQLAETVTTLLSIINETDLINIDYADVEQIVRLSDDMFVSIDMINDPSKLLENLETKIKQLSPDSSIKDFDKAIIRILIPTDAKFEESIRSLKENIEGLLKINNLIWGVGTSNNDQFIIQSILTKSKN